MLRRVAAGQAHRQTQTFTDDSALKENIVAEIADFARNDFIRERFDSPVRRPLRVVSHTGHLAENTTADLLDAGLYASHDLHIPLVFKSFIWMQGGTLPLDKGISIPTIRIPQSRNLVKT